MHLWAVQPPIPPADQLLKVAGILDKQRRGYPVPGLLDVRGFISLPGPVTVWTGDMPPWIKLVHGVRRYRDEADLRQALEVVEAVRGKLPLILAYYAQWLREHPTDAYKPAYRLGRRVRVTA